jgi:DNA-3-methyladenine glycosylase II
MIYFQMTQKDIVRDLKALGKVDDDFGRAIKEVGLPEERRADVGFKTFMGIVVGQQLSVKAAATIRGRLIEATKPNLTPEAYLKLSEEDLRAIGLSRQKVRYCDGLARAVISGGFKQDDLPKMENDEAIKSITALLGFGRWSAEMYLMFSLGRPDVWPADDLAVQEAVRRLKGLKLRPNQKEMDKIAKKWSPYRSAAALFLWHYYAKAPDL